MASVGKLDSSIDRDYREFAFSQNASFHNDHYKALDEAAIYQISTVGSFSSGATIYTIPPGDELIVSGESSGSDLFKNIDPLKDSNLPSTANEFVSFLDLLNKERRLLKFVSLSLDSFVDGLFYVEIEAEQTIEVFVIVEEFTDKIYDLTDQLENALYKHTKSVFFKFSVRARQGRDPLSLAPKGAIRLI